MELSTAELRSVLKFRAQLCLNDVYHVSLLIVNLERMLELAKELKLLEERE